MTKLQTLQKSILLVLILTGLTLAQNKISTELISIRDGLSSNSIRSIIQDQYGYVWIATGDGVNIYDGYNVQVLKNIPGDSTSLADNTTFRILEDSRGDIWITTNSGLSKYNRKSRNFKSYFPSTVALNNYCVDIHEDSKNKLWISTTEGLLEFDRDSEQFIRYDVMKVDNSVATYANYGGSVCENENGDLYVISQSWGLLKFDYKSSLFVAISLKDSFNDQISGNMNFFYAKIDGNNNLWFAGSSGLFKIDISEKKGQDVTPFKKEQIIQNRFLDNSVPGLFINKDNDVWVGTGKNGVYLYHSKNHTFEQVLTGNSFFYSAFYQDKSGILWFGSSRGVHRYDPDKKPLETFKLQSDNLNDATNKVATSFCESIRYKNQIWVGTSNGLMIFDITNRNLVDVSKKFNSLNRLKSLTVTAISESNDDKLWISTNLSGLFSLNLNTGTLKNYSWTNYDNSALKHNSIHHHMLDKNGNLWLGTHEGLNVLKKNEDHFSLVPSFPNREYADNLFKTLKKLRENGSPISSIIEAGDYADISKEFVLRNDSKVIIYSIGEGLKAWNMVDFGWLESIEGDTIWSGGEFSETFHAGGGLKNRITIGLLDLKAGRYKLKYKSDDSHSFESYNVIPPQDTTYWGTQLFSVTEKEFENLSALGEESKNRSYIENEDIQIIYADSKKNIWLGTDEGLSKMDSVYSITNFMHNPADKNSLSSNQVNDIVEDLKGNIWIVTTSGLNKYNPLNGGFTLIGEKDGLPSSHLRSIELDDNGHLWVSGLKGISKIELDEGQNIPIIVNYDVKDGLQGYEFLAHVSLKDKSGKLYFSGVDGFNSFYPGSSNRTPPFLALQDIKISNKSVSDMEDLNFPDLNAIRELSLAHDQNNLSFDFASIHFSRPDKNRLMYKLDGADQDWIITDRRFASYTNLRPGDYTFRLKGSNGDGIWSEETKEVKIYITAPWYNNWFAYSLYVMLFLGFLYSVRRFEMARQQKNTKIQESQLRAEAAELKAMAAESQALVARAENDRKTKELEEARELQLSMLPTELPQLPNLDIAVYMQTATEVGGDYYDFHVGLDGTLTVVIGDATGHGMRAGTMVTAAKSLFNSYAPNPDILFTFHEITRCIKQMNFGKLSMCLTMAKIKGNKLQMSTAGMPPSFIFRRDTRVVEEHLFKAMPLGTMDKFPYEIKDTTLKTGDTILLMSDGLPELKNDRGEMYGYKKIRNGFEDVAEKSPEDIISYLKNEGSSWVNDEAPDDDVTFVVIKVK